MRQFQKRLKEKGLAEEMKKKNRERNKRRGTISIRVSLLLSLRFKEKKKR
jgi:hypothetical protein